MKTIIYILIFLASVFLTKETMACTCMRGITVEYELENKDAVFVGTIKRSEEIKVYDTLNNQIIYRIEMKYIMSVETIYKGQQITDTVNIFTGSGGGDCGYNFQVGQKYIVYASYSKTGNQYNRPVSIDQKSAFNTNICTRTRPYHDKEIKEIKKYLKKKK